MDKPRLALVLWLLFLLHICHTAARHLPVATVSPCSAVISRIAFYALASQTSTCIHAPCHCQLARDAQVLFTTIVRESLLAYGGYESKETQGQVMAAFTSARAALEWALLLQLALLQVG